LFYNIRPMKLLKTLLIVCLFTVHVSAQEMWGTANSNYAGNMGIHLNPSTIVGAPYKYELHYISMDFFAENSYLYVPLEQNAIMKGISGNAERGKAFFDIYDNTLQSGFGHVLLNGPAFIKNNGNDAFAFRMTLRNEISAINVPSPVAKYIYEEYKYEPFVGSRFVTPSFSAAYMTWAELGGTYGKAIIERQRDFLKWAVSGNILFGFDGMFMDARQLDYSVYDSSTIVIHNMDATVGHALQADGKTGFGNFMKLRGLGLSTTIGATYIHNRNRGAFDCNATAGDLKKYQYRIGASLMDFGFMRFFSQTQVLEVKNTDDRIWSRLDSIRFHSFGHLDQLLSNNVNGTTTSVEDKGFTMFVPSAVSIQFDYCFRPHVFANLTWLNRIYYSPQEIARGNQMNLSARYESRRIEANANVSLFEYDQPAVGVGFRIGVFTIGTDRLLEILSLADIRSFDLFFGFKKQFCSWKKRKKDHCDAYK
jgi:hypothetical protein